ncbi:hypothetical protein ABK040_012864 [Willaertia magna]
MSKQQHSITELSVDEVEHILSFFNKKQRIILSLINKQFNNAFEKSIREIRLGKLKSQQWLTNHSRLESFLKRFPEIQLLKLESPFSEVNFDSTQIPTSKRKTTNGFSMSFIQNLLNYLPESFKSLELGHFVMDVEEFNLIIPEDKLFKELIINNCKKLKKLHLINCNSLETIHVVWTDLIPIINDNEKKNIKQISFSHNKSVDDKTLNLFIKDCLQLERLVVSCNQIIETPFEGIELHHLRFLDLSMTSIKDQTILNLNGNVNKLEEIRLRNCPNLQNPKFSNMPQLKIIKLNFSESVVNPTFNKLNNLTSIDMDSCSSLKRPIILQCNQLKYLDVSKSEITDNSLQELLSDCEHLEELATKHCLLLKQPNISHLHLKDIKMQHCKNLTKQTKIECPKLENFIFIGTQLVEMNFPTMNNPTI